MPFQQVIATASSVRVGAVSLPPGVDIPLHAHDAPSLGIVLHGSMLTRSGDRSVECSRGHCTVIPADLKHEHRIGPAGCRGVIIEYLCLDDSHVGNVLAALTPLTGMACLDLRSVLRINAAVHRRDAAAYLEIEGCSLAVLAAMAPAGVTRTAHVPAWIRDVRERLRTYTGTPPPITALAREFRVDPRHLRRLFRTAFGIAPSEYVRSVRLEHAALQLLEARRSLTTIAHELGFADQSHFTNAFRQHFGETPQAFRARQNRL